MDYNIYSSINTSLGINISCNIFVLYFFCCRIFKERRFGCQSYKLLVGEFNNDGASGMSL